MQGKRETRPSVAVQEKVRQPDGHRCRKPAGEERKNGIRETEGLFAVVEGKARRRMGIGAENQQVEKEKTGSGRPKGCLPLSMERHDGRMDTGAKM